jgi:autotransporter-associated beta strand protein
MNDWEQKNLNVFKFTLGQNGFTALKPNTFRLGSGTLPASISNATYIADMAAYTGGHGTITLVDFVNDSAGMSPALFQTAKALSVTNTDGYVGNLQWNNTAKSIELNVTGLPVFYWDNDGTTAGFGTASGTWASPTTGSGSQGWSKDTTGGTLPASLATTWRSSVNFGDGATGLGAGTITVSGSVTNGNITFASGSGAIVLSGGTITLPASATITVNNSSDTISSVLSGAGSSLTKSGLGTLTLSGANSYSGTTTINAGTLALGANNVLTNASPVSIGSATLNAGIYSNKGGTLDPTGSAVINLGAGGTLAFSDSSAIDWTGGALAITGPFVSGSSLRFGTTSNGLTADQLAKISCTGYYKFTLDTNGYLKAQTGTLIMFL